MYGVDSLIYVKIQENRRKELVGGTTSTRDQKFLVSGFMLANWSFNNPNDPLEKKISLFSFTISFLSFHVLQKNTQLLCHTMFSLSSCI